MGHRLRLPGGFRDRRRGRPAARARGRAPSCELALSDVAFTMLSHLGRHRPKRSCSSRTGQSIGNHIYGAFGRDFGTADGKRVMVAAISAGQWTRAGEGLRHRSRDRRARAPTRTRLCRRRRPLRSARCHRGALRAVVRGSARWPKSQKALDANRVCWGLYRGRGSARGTTRASALDNPVWERVETTGIGTHLAAGTPIRAGGAARHDPSGAAARAAHRRSPERGARPRLAARSASCTTRASSPGPSEIRHGRVEHPLTQHCAAAEAAASAARSVQ